MPATSPATHPATAPVASARSLLMAQGSEPLGGTDDMVWLASVEGSGATTQTAVRWRRIFGDTTWQQFPPLSDRVTALTSQGSDLIVVLGEGQWWARYSAGRFVYGPELPAGTSIMLIAADGGSLWAVGAVRDGARGAMAATRPTSRPTTEPTTGPTLAATPVLFEYQSNGQWQVRADLPREAAGAPAEAMSMVAVRGLPVLAVRNGPQIDIWRLAGADAEWKAQLPVEPPFSVSRFKLVCMNDQALLWAAPGGAPGSMWILSPNIPYARWELQTPPPPGRVGRPDYVDLTVAGGAARLFSSVDGQTAEYRYGQGGGKADSARVDDTVVAPEHVDWQMVILLTVMGFMLMSVLRRQQDVKSALWRVGEAWVVAQAWRRLVAACIDAVPLLIGWIMFWLHHAPQDLGKVGLDRWIVLGALVYLAHVTVCEIFFQRSAGKVVMGLWVVDLLGNRPRIGALIVRNVMRIVDIPVPIPGGVLGLLVDVGIMLCSPVRQRVGDIPAGTLVVRRGKPEEIVKLPKVEPEKDEEDEEDEEEPGN